MCNGICPVTVRYLGGFDVRASLIDTNALFLIVIPVAGVDDAATKRGVLGVLSRYAAYIDDTASEPVTLPVA